MGEIHDSAAGLEVGGHVARMTLNRPGKLHALSCALVDGLRAALSRVAAGDSVKVVVLTGAGRASSAGYDLSEEAEDQIEDANSWHQLLSTDAEVFLELLRLPERLASRHCS